MMITTLRCKLLSVMICVCMRCTHRTPYIIASIESNEPRIRSKISNDCNLGVALSIFSYLLLTNSAIDTT